MTKKILIVGGSGFLGFNLAKKLVSSKYKIFLLCKNNKKKLIKLKKAKYLYCDLRNIRRLRKVLTINVDIIINLSGNIDHQNKAETYKTHYQGVKNLVSLLRNKGLKLFIQAGSSLEYGNEKSPQAEHKRSSPKSIYGKAKYLASKFLLSSKNKFKVIILRMYQVYGPYQKKDRLIPQAIHSCLQSKIFSCTEGKQIRDFLYVDDLCNLITKILKKNNLTSGIYNVGTEKPVSVKNVIKKIVKFSKRGEPNFGKIKMRKDEINNLYPNIKKVKKEFNWSPKVSLNKGLIKTIKFYEK